VPGVAVKRPGVREVWPGCAVSTDPGPVPGCRLRVAVGAWMIGCRVGGSGVRWERSGQVPGRCLSLPARCRAPRGVREARQRRRRGASRGARLRRRRRRLESVKKVLTGWSRTRLDGVHRNGVGKFVAVAREDDVAGLHGSILGVVGSADDQNVRPSRGQL
jgi:hypothetical protein